MVGPDLSGAFATSIIPLSTTGQPVCTVMHFDVITSDSHLSQSDGGTTITNWTTGRVPGFLYMQVSEHFLNFETEHCALLTLVEICACAFACSPFFPQAFFTPCRLCNIVHMIVFEQAPKRIATLTDLQSRRFGGFRHFPVLILRAELEALCTSSYPPPCLMLLQVLECLQWR